LSSEGGLSDLEFAQMYAHFGAEVTVLQRSDRVLPTTSPRYPRPCGGLWREKGYEFTRESGWKSSISEAE